MSGSPWLDRIGYVPVLPIAFCFTVGILLDRYQQIPIPVSLVICLLSILGWCLYQRSRLRLANTYFLITIGTLGAAYHHQDRFWYAWNEIGEWTHDEPILGRFRGVLIDQPIYRPVGKPHPFQSRPKEEQTSAILEITAVEEPSGWVSASGRVRLVVDGTLSNIWIGDTVEVLGWLSRPNGPVNPGEWDYRSYLLDQRIRAELHVRKTDQTITRLEEGSWFSFWSWLMRIRKEAQIPLQTELEPNVSGLAQALLLGESSALNTDEWEKYVRGGVIHVLAISGQHLAVLGAFFWLVCRLIGLRRRRTAIVVSGCLLLYALLTGGRPSAMRAAVMCLVLSGGIWLRRPTQLGNTFSLAWLMVLLFDPTDLFTSGFQLSFLSVAILLWGIPRWFPKRERTPLEQLIEESRPIWVRGLRYGLRKIAQLYGISFVLALGLAPLVIYWQNVFSVIGLLLNPFLIVLSSIALISGFLILMSHLFGGLLASVFVWITKICLSGCEQLVDWGDSFSWACWYIGQVPLWWVTGFYVLAMLWILWPKEMIVPSKDQKPQPGDYFRLGVWKPTWSFFPLLLLIWSVAGIAGSSFYRPTDELRISFLAVGHGGCTLLETPDGRVILYDVGALSGPEVTRRHVAPFLWSRGIHRIDEVFISHGDLDHFNGLPSLLKRFAIGTVTVTTSLTDQSSAGVETVLHDLRYRGIPIRQTKAGDQFVLGDVRCHILHPPEVGPDGPENVRSLVMLIVHQGHRILLTGDLEKTGLEQFLTLPKTDVDVLMAPHHGSLLTQPQRLLDWAKPRLIVSCQGPTRSSPKRDNPYTRSASPFWTTHEHGTITIRSHTTGLIAETFRSKQRWVVKMGKGK